MALGPDTNINIPDPPVVAYADIYKKDTVYVGKRKLDGESQAEFHYGDGSYLISFAYRISNPDAMKGGGKASSRGQMKDRRGAGATLPAKEGKSNR
jgi:hypothetical protein